MSWLVLYLQWMHRLSFPFGNRVYLVEATARFVAHGVITRRNIPFHQAGGDSLFSLCAGSVPEVYQHAETGKIQPPGQKRIVGFFCLSPRRVEAEAGSLL
jgi:hypothetical protein